MSSRRQRRAKAAAKAVIMAEQRVAAFINKQRRLSVDAKVTANLSHKPSAHEKAEARAWSRVTCATSTWGEGYSCRGANRVTLSLPKDRIKK